MDNENFWVNWNFITNCRKMDKAFQNNIEIEDSKKKVNAFLIPKPWSSISS
jgi:hypothetical protein